MKDAVFCRKCGTKRPMDGDVSADGKPGAVVQFANRAKHYRKCSFERNKTPKFVLHTGVRMEVVKSISQLEIGNKVCHITHGHGVVAGFALKEVRHATTILYTHTQYHARCRASTTVHHSRLSRRRCTRWVLMMRTGTALATVRNH